MTRRRVVAAEAYRRLLLPCAESALNLCKVRAGAAQARRTLRLTGTSICRYETALTSPDEKRSDARVSSAAHCEP